MICAAVFIAQSNIVSAEEARERVHDAWRPLPCTHEDGLIAERVGLWRDKRLWHVAESDYLLSGFQTRPGTHAWQGEHAGKWLHSATLAHQQTRDEKLGKKLKETVDKLLAAQLPNGYLGTYAERKRFYMVPGDKNSWDVWSHRYNLYGLLTYERFHPDPRIVKACERMADLIIETFGPGKADMTQNGTRLGISTTTVLESMMMLYERTRQERFLKFAEHIVHCSENAAGLRLMGDMLEKKDVSGPGGGKAYQLMANLIGYLLLYQNTGDQRYIDTVRNGWDNITAGHLYTTGGPWSRHMRYNGNRECFALPQDFDPAVAVVETCSTTTWVQLNLHLLQLTGEAKYAAEAERALINAIMGAQAGQGIEWCYYTKANSDQQPFAERINCCASSGPRALEMFSHYMIGTVDGGVSLSSLVPLSATLPEEFGGAKLKVTGNYPFGTQVTIRFKEANGKSFPIEFPEPAGSRLKSAKVNGDEVKTSENNRGFHRITRAWKTGDEINLDIEFLLKSHVEKPKQDVRWVAFTYGPWALAQKIAKGKEVDEPLQGKDIASTPASRWLEPIQSQDTTIPTFRLKNTKIVLEPYYLTGSKTTGPRTYFKF